jgi:integrase
MIEYLPKLLTVKRKLKGGTFGPVEPSDDALKAWEFYLTGLWLSGLRLAESLELYWDREDKLQIDLSGRFGVFRIPAALEKGNQDRELPMAPEFVELLLSVPEGLRAGQVFELPKIVGTGPMSPEQVGYTITALGKLAGVVVKRTPTGDPEKPGLKYASAHDLRRSFGDRWASRVMPQVLMELMRHETIETTMGYYVGKNAQATAAVLWKARGEAINISDNSSPKTNVGEKLKTS